MKKKFISYRLLRASFILMQFMFAGSLLAQSDKLNQKIQELATPRSKPGWIYFRSDININPETIFQQYKNAFDLGSNDEMRIRKVQDDEVGFKHFRYDQFYKGLKVMGAEYIVHVNNEGKTYSANGKLAVGLNASIVTSVNETNALQKALEHAGSKSYLWLDEQMEREKKAERNDVNATWFPKGELVWVQTQGNNDFNPANFRLCWMFDVYAKSDGESRRIFINALDGILVKYLPLSMFCSPATGTTTWHGTQTFNTDSEISGFRLLDDCQSTNLHTRNANGSSNGSGWTEYFDSDNVWTGSTQTGAVQTHFATRMVYSYYSGAHSRYGWDGSFGTLISYHNGTPFGSNNNACWGCAGNAAIFGIGSTSANTDDWNPIDIVGHEFTHGVTQDEAGLEYEYQSGALNESFSDIFGEMVESWTEGNCDWLVGGDRGAIRSLSNPNSYFNPDTYEGDYWLFGSFDNGGVHINSGVQNYWLYLLSEGGSGVNDNGDVYEVTGIGKFAAAQIAYLTLTNYLISTSQYYDAREGSIEAAMELYGNCSNEVLQVRKAWRAVGVGLSETQYDLEVCGTLSDAFMWQGINSVQSGGTTCITSVSPSSGNIIFAAGNYIDLSPGFTAIASSYSFTAYIEPCSDMLVKLGSDTDESNSEQGAPESIINEREDGNITVYPNPFTHTTQISFILNEPEIIKLSIYDITGREVSLLMSKQLEAGSHNVAFDGSSLTDGIYFCRLSIANETSIQKLVKVGQ